MDMLKKKIQETGDDNDVDVTKPFITVDAFKSTGKWYATKNTELKPEHLEMINGNVGFNFADLVKNNDESVRCYSPLSSAFMFAHEYYFHVDVSNCEGFCKYLIGAKR